MSELYYVVGDMRVPASDSALRLFWLFRLCFPQSSLGNCGTAVSGNTAPTVRVARL